MKYYIKPQDVLSFRDSRPFGSTEEHKLHLSFPPSPATIYGALRTSLLSTVNDAFFSFQNIPPEVKNLVGDENRFGALAINDFSLVYGNERIYPTPNDILKIKSKNKDDFEVVIAAPAELKNNITTNKPAETGRLSLPPSEKVVFYEQPPGFIRHSGMVKYLTAQKLDRNDFLPADEFFQSEHRTGIRINKRTRTVEEGALFSVEFARMNDRSSFYIEVNTELKPGVIKLGGEGRSAALSPANLTCGFPELNAANGIKLITVTPLFSKSGFYPDAEITEKIKTLTGFPVELISASVRGYKPVGGWNIVKGSSKPLKRYIPEGSVFYFRTDNANNNLINSKIINISPSEDESKQSFGLVIIGGY